MRDTDSSNVVLIFSKANKNWRTALVENQLKTERLLYQLLVTWVFTFT